MKELYIRKGNIEELKNIIIIGEETVLGGRDSGYKITKGQKRPIFLDTDKYSKSDSLLYIHATPNIKLDTDVFKRDYDVHSLLKGSLFKDIIKWDGESNDGITQSREAFIPIKYDINETCKILYNRLESIIHNTIVQDNSYQYGSYIIPLSDYVFGKDIIYRFNRVSICNKCSGIGKINKNICHHCNGTGKEIKRLYISYIQKPYDMSPIRINKGGDLDNFFNYPTLIVKKVVDKDPRFRIDEDGDLYADIKIPFFIWNKLDIELPNRKIVAIKKENVKNNKLIKLSNILPNNHSIYLKFLKGQGSDNRIRYTVKNIKSKSQFTNKTKAVSIRQSFFIKKGTFFYFLVVFLIICIVLVRKLDNNSKQKLPNQNLVYDYRYKISDENDKWLLSKCQNLISKKGKHKSLIDEAYYSSKFSSNNTWAVHSYNSGRYIVIRIKKGQTEQQEQNSINAAINYVNKYY